jgi:hypothetical protein
MSAVLVNHYATKWLHVKGGGWVLCFFGKPSTVRQYACLPQNAVATSLEGCFISK